METIEIPFRLHRVQQAFRQSKALYRGFVGGRGAGKSTIGAYDMIRRGKRGHTYLIASPTGVKLMDETYPTFKAMAQAFGFWDVNAVRLSPYPTVTITTGATFRFRSAERPDSMRGPNLSGAWLDEASLMEEEAFMVVIGCLREHGEMGSLSATFTPAGRQHWTYKVFGMGGVGVALFRAHTRDNPFNPPGFAEQLATQYVGARARQELGGEFTDIQGAEWGSEFFDGPGFWFTDWPRSMEIKVMALDPSKGADAHKGDYQALVLYGRDEHGAEYVEADLSRDRPMAAARAPDGTQLTDGMVENAVERYREFQPEALAIETNQMQQLLLIPFRTAAQIAKVNMRFIELDNRANKKLRIRRLTEPLGQRRLRFRDTPGTRLLVDQMREFSPEENPQIHDDGPDALEMARRCSIEIYNGRQAKRQQQGRRR